MIATEARHGARARILPAGLAALAFLLLALAFRVGHLHGTAFFDEFYHLLAARGLLETGRPAILDGEYARNRLFTAAVADLFRLTGSDTLATGRLLSVAAGTLLPPLLFFWLRVRAGWTAALVAAGLAVLWPEAIDEAQRLRFYTWHALFAVLGAIAVFEAVEGGTKLRGRLGWGLVAALAFLAALYLQITTAFALAAILAWFGLVHVLPWLWGRERRWLWLGLAVAACLAAVAAAAAGGVLDRLWEQYRWVPGWAEQRSDNPGYYHGLLRDDYPVFWPLLPFAALFGLRARPRLALYAILVFGLGLVTLSFGGMKAYRYLSYAMPFFFLLIGLATAELARLLAAPLAGALGRFDPTRRGWPGQAAVGLAILFFLAANPFFARSLDALRGGTVRAFDLQDWSRVAALVGDWAPAPYLVTTRELPTIAYLGDYDVLYNRSRMTEMDPPVQFGIDGRTGRPVIDAPAAVAAILACHPEGLFVTEAGQWRDQGVGDELEPVFDASGRRIERRAQGGLLALRWSGGTASAAACATLPPARGAGS